MLISLQPDMELVGATAEESELVELLHQHKPDTVLLDLDLPEFRAVWLIREIRDAYPAACIIGLHTHLEDERVAAAIRAGASSCLTKGRLNRDLLTVMRKCISARRERNQ
jgi:NarL family two-component system response regulator LiaR